MQLTLFKIEKKKKFKATSRGRICYDDLKINEKINFKNHVANHNVSRFFSDLKLILHWNKEQVWMYIKKGYMSTPFEIKTYFKIKTY